MFEPLRSAVVWDGVLRKEKAYYEKVDRDDFDPFVADGPSEQEQWQKMTERGREGKGPLADLGQKPVYVAPVRRRAKPLKPVDPPGRFRMPLPGEPVRLEGLASRPHLNGCLGEVISRGLDDEGFVTVSLIPSIDGVKESRGRDRRPEVMKVRPHRLQPLQVVRSASTSMLKSKDGSRFPSWASAYTCSDATRSVASGRGSIAARSRASQATSVNTASTEALSMSWFNQNSSASNSLAYLPTKSIV
eukprot:TRINITY_DN23967_c0_g1_i1.p1 TRINITY_DN23967_c0_g1~~TRINITY_DN23967_c0_g1_i1.p1  ORF type:complete len:246 (+),score=43.73 TRINITY_DN23967_c0_g1_i1:138-875(+)